MEKIDWNQVTTRKLIGFWTGMGVFMLLVLKSEPGFVFLLDHANLLFHEAGHPAVGLFSDRLETYGGTMGQLTFPVVLAVLFLREGGTLSFSGLVGWGFEELLKNARYIGDPRAQELPHGRGAGSELCTNFLAVGVRSRIT